MRLVKPNINLKEAYLEMLTEWKSTKEEMVPFSLKYETSDFEKFLKINKEFEIKAEKGFVKHSTFWLLDDKNDIVGTSNIRHALNDNLLIKNGHIGYGIRPTFRRKGYATKLLTLSLEKARTFGIREVLLTCDETNIASKNVIIKNGGIFRNKVPVDGKEVLSFWVNLKSP